MRDYVVAFDDGKYGCRKNKRFVFRMLDSYYSVGNRKLTDPALLQRYAFNFSEDADPAKRGYVYNLLWLFTESGTYLPMGWTEADARAFVERPEHWPIALAKFGKMRARDDAVFASLVDPQSSHFDRQRALKLLDFPSKHLRQRKILVAELFADPRFGPPEYAIAERLLPVAALYPVEEESPARQQARAIWGRVIDAYNQSGDPALRAKADDLRAKMAPLALNGWPVVAPAKDGRVWLSPADWPQKVRNPFVGVQLRAALMNANDYPSRALREERTGKVTLAVRFGLDGKFAALDVVRSSGHTDLDEQAAKTILRRFRPKLTEMTVEGYQGREVMVPLVVVNWDISEESGENGEVGLGHFSSGVLSVVALSRFADVNQGYSCGIPPSIFV
ncbi:MULTISPECIES: TonB family protein [unclassified Novosphingobium]|uniref:TonB family protein n=1 Tax=unclassified Novosphingobium TaxID=2644732 RepID=UPI0025E62165|nr:MULTISPECIES: TonB family protein [unclassified Novosphingobium]HQV03592.1 TonB family protein [Novosphingobium sp.]